jgi:hypothetical protein
MITLPDTLDVDQVAEDAMQTAFKLIADRIDEACGGHTWGDVDPLESHRIDQEFRGWVRMMAENNTALQAAEQDRQRELNRPPRCE